MAEEQICGCDESKRLRARVAELEAKPDTGDVSSAIASGSPHRPTLLEVERLKELINTPRTNDFFEAVRAESAHQVERFGAAHDAGKEPQDWFWLLGYLSGKALAAALKSDTAKALHHTISSAAALLNWHRALNGEPTAMRPGIIPPGQPAPGERLLDQSREAVVPSPPRAIRVGQIWLIASCGPYDDGLREVVLVDENHLDTTRVRGRFGGGNWGTRRDDFYSEHTFVSDPPTPATDDSYPSHCTHGKSLTEPCDDCAVMDIAHATDLCKNETGPLCSQLHGHAGSD